MHLSQPLVVGGMSTQSLEAIDQVERRFLSGPGDAVTANEDGVSIMRHGSLLRSSQDEECVLATKLHIENDVRTLLQKSGLGLASPVIYDADYYTPEMHDREFGSYHLDAPGFAFVSFGVVPIRCFVGRFKMSAVRKNLDNAIDIDRQVAAAVEYALHTDPTAREISIPYAQLVVIDKNTAHKRGCAEIEGFRHTARAWVRKQPVLKRG